MSSSNARNAKALGAYYTDQTIADFLVRWAVRSSRDTVLDPSFGGGVFLRSADKHIQSLGGNPEFQVFGVELDAGVHATVCTTLARESRVSRSNLFLRDFFDVEPLPTNQLNAVVGNPPFIRYQKFPKSVRDRAILRAREQGVELTQLSSSWAPFVVHSIAMIKKGGRLALVLPVELGHAKYAVPVLNHLVNSFGRLTILTFQEKLFPHLSEDTLLLLADEKGAKSKGIFYRDLKHPKSLPKLAFSPSHKLYRTRLLKTAPLVSRSKRLIEYLLPRRIHEFYGELKSSNLTMRLGEVVDVGIGYVTGANDFFHLSPTETKQFQIPIEFLRRAVRRGRALNGLRFTDSDWKAGLISGDAGYLLFVPDGRELPAGLLDYLSLGRATGIPDAFKCRSRKPWYVVPHVARPDAFLTYMSGETPRLVTNEADAVAPNTLHTLKLRASAGYSPNSIASLWRTSMTRLSVEIEGHALGGGMLKLEPSEAEKCLVPNAGEMKGQLEVIHYELDQLVREGKESVARELADSSILRGIVGLSRGECEMLDQGARILMNRRYRRTPNELA